LRCKIVQGDFRFKDGVSLRNVFLVISYNFLLIQYVITRELDHRRSAALLTLRELTQRPTQTINIWIKSLFYFFAHKKYSRCLIHLRYYCTILTMFLLTFWAGTFHLQSLWRS